MTDLDSPQAAAIEMPEQQHRRFPFLGKRTGEVAMAASSEVVIENEIYLFGLESDLETYYNLWVDHAEVVSEFIGDTDNVELLRATISEQNNFTDDRQGRRQVAKFQERDLQSLAAIFVTSGRMHAYMTDIKRLWEFGGTIDPKDTMETVRQITTAWRQADAKRAGFFTPMTPTSNSIKFKDELEALAERSRSTYKPIIRHELSMQAKIAKELHDNPDAAVNLLDIFLECSGCESRLEKGLATFLANDYLSKKEHSLIAGVLKQVEDAATTDEYSSRFIDDQLTASEGDNLLAFFAQKVEALTGEPFNEYMAVNYDEWPTDLQKSYEDFSKTLVSRYKSQVLAASERTLKKAWLPPDLDSFEDAIDRAYKRIYSVGFPRQYAKRRSTKPDRYRATPQDALGDQSGERKPKELEAVAVIRTPQGFITQNGQTLETVLDRFISGRTESAVKEEILRIVQHLRVKPFENNSARLLDLGNFHVDGKSRKVYRVRPERITGLSLATRAKDASVIFTVSNGHFGILGIPLSHKEYEQLIISL